MTFRIGEAARKNVAFAERFDRLMAGDAPRLEGYQAGVINLEPLSQAALMASRARQAGAGTPESYSGYRRVVTNRADAVAHSARDTSRFFKQLWEAARRDDSGYNMLKAVASLPEMLVAAEYHGIEHPEFRRDLERAVPLALNEYMFPGHTSGIHAQGGYLAWHFGLLAQANALFDLALGTGCRYSIATVEARGDVRFVRGLYTKAQRDYRAVSEHRSIREHPDHVQRLDFKLDLAAAKERAQTLQDWTRYFPTEASTLGSTHIRINQRGADIIATLTSDLQGEANRTGRTITVRGLDVVNALINWSFRDLELHGWDPEYQPLHAALQIDKYQPIPGEQTSLLTPGFTTQTVERFSRIADHHGWTGDGRFENTTLAMINRAYHDHPET